MVAAVIVTLVAVLGGVGILPSGGPAASAQGRAGTATLVTSTSTPDASTPADDGIAKGTAANPGAVGGVDVHRTCRPTAARASGWSST